MKRYFSRNVIVMFFSLVVFNAFSASNSLPDSALINRLRAASENFRIASNSTVQYKGAQLKKYIKKVEQDDGGYILCKYDEQERLKEHNLYADYWGEEIILDHKKTFEYDNRGNLLVLLEQDNDIISKMLEDKNKVEYTYNDQNVMTSATEWDYDYDTKGLIYYKKYLYETNTELNIYTEIEQKYWDGEWFNSEKIEKTVYADGDSSISIMYDWDDDWVLIAELKAYMNSEGKDTLVLGYRLNEDTDELVPFYKERYMYDANNKLLLEGQYRLSNDVFVVVLEKRFKYNSMGKISRMSQLGNIFGSNTDDTTYAESFTYYPNGSVESKKEYMFDFESDSKDLFVYGKDVYKYRTDLKASDLHFPSENALEEIDGFFSPSYHEDAAIDSVIYYVADWDTHELHLAQKNKFIYSDLVTPISQVKVSSVSVYPNPAKNYLNIQNITGLQTASIFDVTGKLVLKTSLINNEPIYIGNLDKGIYLIHLNNRSTSIRFIKQ